MQKITLFFLLLLAAFACKKKDDGNNAPLSLEGSWRVQSIRNQAGVTPSNLSSLVGGMWSFSSQSYELSDNSSQLREQGSYSYDAAANSLSLSPSTLSVLTNSTAAYTGSTTLAGSSLSVELNLAPAGKPAETLRIALTKTN